MTMTYDTSTNIGKVRLLINDTSTTAAHFTDAEIQVFLDLYDSVIRLSAAQALESWASSLAQSADSERIGDYSYTKKQVNNMLALAERLRQDEYNKPAIDWSEMDFTTYGEVEGMTHFF
jgi:hypothetical protein